MGLSEKYINLLNHPAVDATINFIKKFKSSKSYWSVSYVILLFTIREAIAWKFGSAIQTFCETQAVDSSMPMLWTVIGFIFDVGGSWELVALGTFVFVVLSLVKVAESEGTSISVRENYLTLFLVVFVGSLSFYQNDEVKSIVHDNHEILKNIESDKNETNYLRDDLERERVKYAKLQKEFYALRKSVKEKAPNDSEIIKNANKILEEQGIESAIFYLKLQLSYLKSVEEITEVSSQTNIERPKSQKESIQTVEDANKEDNNTIVDFIELESEWIKPSNATCTSNGGEVTTNGCKAKWEDAKTICSVSGGSLPSIERLRKVVTDCGGIINNKNNKNNVSYQACFKNKGFTIWVYWSKTAKNSSSAWLVTFLQGNDGWSITTVSNDILCIRGQ